MFLKEPERNCQQTNNSSDSEAVLRFTECSNISATKAQIIIANEENQSEHTDEEGNKIRDYDFNIRFQSQNKRDDDRSSCINITNDIFKSMEDNLIDQETKFSDEKNCDDNDNVDDDLSDNEIENNKEEYEPEETLFNYEDSERSYSSADVSPVDGIYNYDVSDSEDSCIQDVNDVCVLPRGIHNPNYPGFQHLAYTLQDYSPQISEAYENTLFSNVYIQCKDEEELLKLTLSNQPRDGSNRDITKNLKDYDYSDDDEGISTKFNDFEDSECVRDISSDSAIFDNRETDCSQDDTYLHSSSISTTDEFSNWSSSCEFQEELKALRYEIYDIIQKPLASTIESVSEVINTVIRHIVEYQSQNNVDIWNSLSQEAIQNYNKSYQAEMELNTCIPKSEISAENTHGGGGEHTSRNGLNYNGSNEIVIETARTTVDAYITNVKEELFKSPDYEKHICDKTYLATDFNAEKNRSELSPTTSNSTDANFNSVTAKKLFSDKIRKSDANRNSNENNKAIINNEKSENNEDIITKPIHDRKGPDQNVKQNSITQETAGFDVYNIETSMPFIDLDIIENHLRAAREEERRRRNDREEIRRRLALGAEVEELYKFGDRPGRKPSLQTRLQSGMNLQICFMNETASDTDSPSEGECGEADEEVIVNKNKSEHKSQPLFSIPVNNTTKPKHTTTNKKDLLNKGAVRPSTLPLNDMARPTISSNPSTRAAFFECQARLQTEARMALAQAKELAHIQMEVERNKSETSPITEMLRNSLLKAGVKLTGDRRRVSRQMLTDMNVAQLQVIVNELHTQIEFLNESLVKLLIARDELHMGQDSMLVDIEDLTRYLSAKELTIKAIDDISLSSDYTSKSHVMSLSSLLNK